MARSASARSYAYAAPYEDQWSYADQWPDASAFTEPLTDTANRLAALAELQIMDSQAEPEFDDIVLLASQIAQTPVALVSLVTHNRQWFKARVGLSSCETPLEQSVCKFAMQDDDVLVIPDLTADERTRHNTLVTSHPFIRFYAGAPLKNHEGIPIGSLCVIDTQPRPQGLSEAQRTGMKALARQAMSLLEARRTFLMLRDIKDTQHAITSSALKDEMRVGGLREQFVAILAHDLRSPLGSIDAGVTLLELNAAPERTAEVLPLIKSSVARMVELIETTLDFSRARLGGGIGTDSHDREPLQPVLQHVIDELAATAGAERIEATIDLREAVHCDNARVAQLFSNLLSNALTHGAKDRPISVSATAHDGMFTLSVANGGQPIPANVLERIFQPFSHKDGLKRQGLGLGLYISSEIARAHGGTLSVSSKEDQTRFVFQMPTRPADRLD